MSGIKHSWGKIYPKMYKLKQTMNERINSIKKRKPPPPPPP